MWKGWEDKFITSSLLFLESLIQSMNIRKTRCQADFGESLLSCFYIKSFFAFIVKPLTKSIAGYKKNLNTRQILCGPLVVLINKLDLFQVRDRETERVPDSLFLCISLWRNTRTLSLCKIKERQYPISNWIANYKIKRVNSSVLEVSPLLRSLNPFKNFRLVNSNKNNFVY